MADEDFDDPFDLPDEASTREIRRKLDQILRGQQEIMADLTTLTADVAAETTVNQSAIALLQGLKAALDAAGTDPVALAALSTQLETNTSALAAAVTANTLPPAGATGATGSAPPPPPPAALTISPDPINLPVTVAESIPLTITGGTGSISAAGLPAGVTFTGSVIVADGTAAAGATAVTFSDSSTPPVEGTANVVVA